MHFSPVKAVGDHYAPAHPSNSPAVDAGILVLVARAKQILLVAGICVAVAGGMDLGCPGTSPKAFSHAVSPEGGQSLFVWVAMTGALNRQGVILILVGLGCLALAWILPSGRA